MNPALPTIPLVNLLAAFAPSLLLLIIMHRWSLKATTALYANLRMLVQLLLVGYVLTYVFETDQAILILAVVAVMILVSAWIALRPLQRRGMEGYSLALVSIAASGLPSALNPRRVAESRRPRPAAGRWMRR